MKNFLKKFFGVKEKSATERESHKKTVVEKEPLTKEEIVQIEKERTFSDGTCNCTHFRWDCDWQYCRKKSQCVSQFTCYECDDYQRETEIVKQYSEKSLYEGYNRSGERKKIVFGFFIRGEISMVQSMVTWSLDKAETLDATLTIVDLKEDSFDSDSSKKELISLIKELKTKKLSSSDFKQLLEKNGFKKIER